MVQYFQVGIAQRVRAEKLNGRGVCREGFEHRKFSRQNGSFAPEATRTGYSSSSTAIHALRWQAAVAQRFEYRADDFSVSSDRADFGPDYQATRSCWCFASQYRYCCLRGEYSEDRHSW